jgi:hypothetical protein
MNKTSSLTLTLIDNVSKESRDVATALAQAEAKVKEISGAMAEGVPATDRLVSSLSKLSATKEDIAAVSAAWRDYTRASGLAGEAGNWTKEQIADVRSWESQTIGSVRSVIRERQAETTAMRRVVAEQNELLRRQAEEQATIAREQVRVPRGGAGGLAAHGSQIGQALPLLGPAIVAAVVKGVEAAAKIQGADIANMSAGIPGPERNAAERQAIALSAKYPNLGTAEVLKTYKELRSVLPDSAEVPKMMDVVTKAKSAMEASGLDVDGLVYALKAAELLGKASSPEALKDYLNSFVKAQQVEGKTIDPEGMFNFAQQLKAAAPNLSSRFVNTLGPLLLQELGANGGTAVQQFEKQIQGGFQGNLHAAAKEFVAIGLAHDDDFEHNKTGQILGMKHGHSVVGADIAEHDPDKWVYDTLVPALVKAGYKTTEDQIKELPRLFPNTNAANVVAKLLQQKDQWAAKADRIDAAPGTDSLPEQMQGVAVAFGAFKTQLIDFIGVFDGPAMKDIGTALSFMTTELGAAKIEVDKFAQAFPTAARGLADLGVAAGAAAGGWLSLKMFSGFGLGKSALALDSSAEQLMVAAQMLKGENALGNLGGHGPGRSPSGMSSLRGRAGLAAGGAAALMAGAPSDDAAINEALNDNSKSVVGQAVAESVDALRRLASDATAWARGFEITRPAPAHPGRDVHSPQSGPYSYTPAQKAITVTIDVDDSAVSNAVSRIKDAAASVGAAFTQPRHPPSLGSAQRGFFSFGGISGE